MAQDSITPLSFTVTATKEISVVTAPFASALAASPDRFAITERPVFTAPSVTSTISVSTFSTSPVGFSITTIVPVHPTSILAVIAIVKIKASNFFIVSFLPFPFNFVLSAYLFLKYGIPPRKYCRLPSR